MILLFISLAPVILILIYIYIRDKYEKEPANLLLKAIALGAIITIPVFFIELYLSILFQAQDKITDAFYKGFIVAATTEELFKFLAFMVLIWKNKNFNEFFDGIIYAVYISLGFAAVENIFYVFGSGGGVGILRAFTAVPAHALFGIVMGYYIALARFEPAKKSIYLFLGLFMPFLLHGIYDFILFSKNGWLMLFFIPYLVYIWISGFKKMKIHSENSIFKGLKRKLF